MKQRETVRFDFGWGSMLEFFQYGDLLVKRIRQRGDTHRRDII